MKLSSKGAGSILFFNHQIKHNFAILPLNIGHKLEQNVLREIEKLLSWVWLKIKTELRMSMKQLPGETVK